MSENGEKRVALVIGNARYRYGAPLRNPHQDAEALAGMLARLGFDLIRSHSARERGWHADLDFITMRRLIADFGVAADNADMAAIYFAGHGLEVDGENYLLPVDAELDHVRRVRAETSSLREVLDHFIGVKTLPLVILDACRDNPFVARMRGLETARSFRSGLADVEPAGDVLVAYAARQGAKAHDGPAGGNSPFAAALLNHLETPDVDIRILLGRVRDAVRDATSRTQFPHVYGSLGGKEVYLRRSKADAASTEQVTGASQLAIAKVEWEQIKDASDAAKLKRFITYFSGTYFAELAQDRIAELEKAERQAKEEAARRAKAEAQRIAEEEAERKRREDAEQRREAEERARAEEEALKRREAEEARNRQDAQRYAPATVTIGARRRATSKPGESFRDFDGAPEMVVIPPGEFLMGSKDGEGFVSEHPQHKVSIPQAFAVGEYPVTFAEWDAAVAAGGVSYKPGDGGCGRGRRPVINVSWNDAKSYVKWLSKKTGQPYRLLSEAEWEYACRAGTTTAYSFGASITKKQAQFSDSEGGSAGGTVEVGSFPPNAFGLYDMHGNVWEWCEDCWNTSYKGAPANGSAWTTGDRNLRVLRGGSWFGYPRFLRSAYRLRYYSGFRDDFNGFRVARTLTS